MKHYRINPIIDFGEINFKIQEWVWYWPIWWDTGYYAKFKTRKEAEKAIQHLKGK